MKRNNSPAAGIIPLSVALVFWFSSFMIKESSFQLSYWIHENILMKGNSIETDAALIVAVLYAVVTYVAVVLLAATITRLIYKKSLFECLQRQIYRYFAFWGLLPLTITGMCWDIIWPFLPAKSVEYRLPLPAIDIVLDLSSAFCETVLFITVVLMVLSIVSFAYGIFVNSNIKFNRVCAAFWIVYAYYTAYILPPYFEYGKWFLLFIALSYVVGILLFTICKTTQKTPLIPKYEILVLSFDEFENDDKFVVDEEKEYDFSIFMPKEKEDENE